MSFWHVSKWFVLQRDDERRATMTDDPMKFLGDLMAKFERMEAIAGKPVRLDVPLTEQVDAETLLPWRGGLRRKWPKTRTTTTRTTTRTTTTRRTTNENDVG
jgi:hypothetical protein